MQKIYDSTIVLRPHCNTPQYQYTLQIIPVSSIQAQNKKHGVIKNFFFLYRVQEVRASATSQEIKASATFQTIDRH